jgi:hypothetical protein
LEQTGCRFWGAGRGEGACGKGFQATIMKLGEKDIR